MAQLSKPGQLYDERPLTAKYPGLGETDLDAFVQILEARPDGSPRLQRLLGYFRRLVEFEPPRRMLVVGCGPRPLTVKWLREQGYEAVGVEPVLSFVESGRLWLNDQAALEVGAAECLPAADESVDFVWCESVLEHVDSPRMAIDEMYRVLKPGGCAYLVTTNRHRFRLDGANGEFKVPFFNWLPNLVRESYVHEQLHYRPVLANHTTRPCVHWFTFGELCRLGRLGGFAHFYSLLDLLRPSDSAVQRNIVRRSLLRPMQRNPWMRALALTQVGGAIVMVKRP